MLLTERSGFQLRPVGSGQRRTFTHSGEQWLDAWMEANAFVTWIEHPEPWGVEADVFQRLAVPLNLQNNGHHAFHARLSAMQTDAKRRAEAEPIVDERNQQRRG